MNKLAAQTYWYLLNERHNVYLRKEAGQPWPWSKDEILQQYKFTNVFRELDKTTKPIIKELKSNDSPASVEFFNICLYRMFNWTPTYYETGGWCKRWNSSRKQRIIDYKKKGNKLFTGAYIIPNIGSTLPKVQLAFNTLDMLWKDKTILTSRITKGESVRSAVEILTMYPMLGGFMAYEIVCDMLYTPMLEHAYDRFDWANPGPGAKRGIKFIFTTEFMNSNIYCVNAMRNLFGSINKNVGNHITKEPYPVDMRFIENGLCEFSKYWRIKYLGKRGKNKYRRTDK